MRAFAAELLPTLQATVPQPVDHGAIVVERHAAITGYSAVRTPNGKAVQIAVDCKGNVVTTAQQ